MKMKKKLKPNFLRYVSNISKEKYTRTTKTNYKILAARKQNVSPKDFQNYIKLNHRKK